MNKIGRRIVAFLFEEDSGTHVEYAILMAALAIAAAIAITHFFG